MAPDSKVGSEAECVESIILPKGTVAIDGTAVTRDAVRAGFLEAPRALVESGEPIPECCYQWTFDCRGGRPLLDGREAITAELSASNQAWSARDPGPLLPVAPALRSELASAWLDDALAEHASVAAFARATLELMAVGAPPALLGATQRAGLDEIRHAALCFGIAAAYGASDAAPGPLLPTRMRTIDLRGVARSTFFEGCLGETVAALVAARAASRCQDPAIAAVLRTIADDEARHAALAWSVVRWALSVGGESIADELRRCRRAVATGEVRLGAPGAGGIDQPHLGRLGPESTQAAAEDAWVSVVEPMLDEVLYGCEPIPRA